MENYPIIIDELSIPNSSVPKETIVGVRTPIENEVKGSHTPYLRVK